MFSVVKTIAMATFKAVMTEKFIKQLVIYFLKYLAKKSTNTVDDKVVAEIEKAFKSQDEK